MCFAMPSATEGGDLMLIPAPDAQGRITGNDGRTWFMRDPAAVAAATGRRRAITENHARLLKAPKGEPAPAFGWIEPTTYTKEDGSIWFKPDWNSLGQVAVNDRQYGYLSPEFEHDEAGNVVAIVGAALVNDPNFTQLVAKNSEEQNPEPTMSLKEIALALGLAEDADEAAILAAIKALKEKHQVAANAAQHPDPANFMPTAQYQVAMNRANAAETELKTLKDGKREESITALIDGALKDGKIVPATKEYFTAMCRAEGGEDRFREFLKTQPVIAGDDGDKNKVPPKGLVALNADQQATLVSLGLTEDEFRKANGLSVASA